MFMAIASEEEIYKIMSMGVDKSDRAIITLLLSSGLPSKFIEGMTFTQLLDACDHFFEYDEMKTIERLVRKDPIGDKLIACFDIGKESRPRMTCCSPESLQLIIEYLHYRLTIKDGTEYVFLNHNNEPIANKDYISFLFRRAREKANRYSSDEDSLNIKSNDVRNRFKYICENHLRGDYRSEVLVLMEGSDSANNKRFYESVKKNRLILIDHYLTVVDYLTLSSNTNRFNYTISNYTLNFR